MGGAEQVGILWLEVRLERPNPISKGLVKGRAARFSK